MSTIELLILGLALSMDAFAVTVSNAFVYRGTDKAHRLLMPVFFGVFQGLMPVIGFYAGSLVGPFIETYAGIITFVILGFIGGKIEMTAPMRICPESPLEQSFIRSIALSISLSATHTCSLNSAP